MIFPNASFPLLIGATFLADPIPPSPALATPTSYPTIPLRRLPCRDTPTEYSGSSSSTIDRSIWSVYLLEYVSS